MRIHSSIFIALIFVAGLSSSGAFAAKPVITNITGASVMTLTGTITAIGGFGGQACTNADTSLTCDNCSAGQLLACNPSRAYNSLYLRIYASHTDAGNLMMYRSDSTKISTTPNNASYVGVTWGTICANLGSTASGVADCEFGSTNTATEGTVRVCVDKDYDDTLDTGEECEEVKIRVSRMDPASYSLATTEQGITDFNPYPGDEKIYMKDLITSTNFPNLPHGGKITGMRVFIGQGNMTDAKPQAGLTPKDLTLLADSATLDNSVVDGLTNGTPYWFRVALRDEAGNLGYFWPNDGYTDADGAACDSGPCRYSATPDEVVGMLTDDVNCFIASAAYGTSFNEKLDTFREFRFRKLLPLPWGREFVKSYYHYGPYAARYIHDKPVLRAVTRGALYPAYGFSLLSLRFGLLPATLISLFAMTALIALPLIGVRRFIPRA